MENYIPAIQDAFRRTGFPIERAGKVRQVTFGPGATAPVEMVERQRWEYHNREETWSVLVTEDSVILQTTACTRFEQFAERLQFAVNTVLTGSEHDGFAVIHRVGLRYIDVVRPSAGKGFRSYLRRGLHGVPDEVFQPGRHLLHVESRGETVVGGDGLWPGPVNCTITSSRHSTNMWSPEKRSRSGNDAGSRRNPGEPGSQAGGSEVGRW